MKIRTVVAAVAAVGFYAQSASAFDYKAERDFSYQNPAGVWSYGGRTVAEPRTFSLFTQFVTDAVPGADQHQRGNALVSVNTRGYDFNDPGSSTVVIPDNMLKMNPSDSEDAVVRFQVPNDGSYRFEGIFQIADTSPTGVLLFILRGNNSINRTVFDRVLVRLLGKGAVRDDKRPKLGKAIPFDFTLTDLVAGEFISFVVNNDGNWTFDNTAFDVKVTPQ